jgi:TolB-like protein
VAVAAVLVFTTRPHDAARDAGPAHRRVMLAILPFENLTGDPEQGFIGDD